VERGFEGDLFLRNKVEQRGLDNSLKPVLRDVIRFWERGLREWYRSDRLERIEVGVSDCPGDAAREL
jgi:hypothetical protein